MALRSEYVQLRESKFEIQRDNTASALSSSVDQALERASAVHDASDARCRMKVSLRRDLEQRAHDLRTRLELEEQEKEMMRDRGRSALSLADSILQGVESSLSTDGLNGGAQSARLPRNKPLQPISIMRPDTAEQ